MAGQATGRAYGRKLYHKAKTDSPTQQDPSIWTSNQQRARLRAENQLHHLDSQRKQETSQYVTPCCSGRAEPEEGMARQGQHNIRRSFWPARQPTSPTNMRLDTILPPVLMTPVARQGMHLELLPGLLRSAGGTAGPSA